MNTLAEPLPITWVAPPETVRAASRLAAPKILLYSHDTFGLGNIRRTLLLAEALKEEFVGAAILIVTGSPVIHSFRIPAGIDYIKLPCLDRTEADHYEPRFLQDWPAETKQTRQAILNNSILGFNPDLMIVDKRPGGVDGELLGTIEELRQRGRSTRLILGIRDILDEPARTQQSLKRARDFEIIERYYDEVWIYGVPAIFNPIKEYAFPDVVACKTHFCGYLQRPIEVRLREGGPPRVLVTTGGGGDGGDIIETYLEGLIDLPRRVALRSTIIFGPQMPDSRRSALLERYGQLSDVKFRDFEADLTPRYAKADVVISMAGYNTVCELLSFGRRTILIPREKPVYEQLIRARLFAGLGFFDIIESEELTPAGLMAKVQAAVEQGPTPMPPIDLGGLSRIKERTRTLLKGKAR
ncbi:MAG: glycosyltransferase [Anaerolineae bacterium]|nr:glycosyltransferase [Anaerolineales bacterium]MCQ3975655.1 glycosyltransferase [Anaerolineae bacterium]